MTASVSNTPLYYFFIGTEAELIKMFPVITAFKKKKLPYKIIASGQNNIQNSQLLHVLQIEKIDIILSQQQITQTVFGLLSWFFLIFLKSIFTLKKEWQKNKKRKKILLVHGDTVSTVMGALLGRIGGVEVVHVEAGLRSFDFFNPFPEEIDRFIVSKLASIHFCPNAWALKNIQQEKGVKINTYQNTLIESLDYGLKMESKDPLLVKMQKKTFFIFIMHRQENLLQINFVQSLIKEIEKTAEEFPCLFVVHASTKHMLQTHNLWKKIEKNKHIILSSRLDYFTFIHLLAKAQFLITDGGSNQEEAYYLGKPCLIMRKATERIEGLDQNVVLNEARISDVKKFILDSKKYQRPRVYVKQKPSEIIAEYFVKTYGN